MKDKEEYAAMHKEERLKAFEWFIKAVDERWQEDMPLLAKYEVYNNLIQELQCELMEADVLYLGEPLEYNTN